MTFVARKRPPATENERRVRALSRWTQTAIMDSSSTTSCGNAQPELRVLNVPGLVKQVATCKEMIGEDEEVERSPLCGGGGGADVSVRYPVEPASWRAGVLEPGRSEEPLPSYPIIIAVGSRIKAMLVIEGRPSHCSQSSIRHHGARMIVGDEVSEIKRHAILLNDRRSLVESGSSKGMLNQFSIGRINANFKGGTAWRKQADWRAKQHS